MSATLKKKKKIIILKSNLREHLDIYTYLYVEQTLYTYTKVIIRYAEERVNNCEILSLYNAYIISI